MTTSTIIHASAAHQLLAVVPNLAGFTPTRSLVCVVFRGNRSVGVLRHDLPPRIADHRALVSAVLGMLCRIEGVDGVVPVVYTDRPYPRSGGAAPRRLLATFSDRLESAGFAVRDSLIVASDAWGSTLDPDTPAEGHPLDLIAEAAADFEPSVPEDLRLSQTEPPRVNTERAERIARHLDAVEAGRGEGTDAESFGEVLEDALGGVLGGALHPVGLVESLLTDEVDDAAFSDEWDASRLAWLAHLCSHAAFRDAIVLQFAFGATVGELALEGALDANERAADAGISVDDLVLADIEAEAVPEVDEYVTSLFLGQTRLRPDAERIRRAIRVVEIAVRETPRRWHPGLLCVAAWSYWAIGRGSRAGELVDEALAVDPEHPLARLLQGYFATGTLPEWVFTDP